jgi:hypothetical protein
MVCPPDPWVNKSRRSPNRKPKTIKRVELLFRGKTTMNSTYRLGLMNPNKLMLFNKKACKNNRKIN